MILSKVFVLRQVDESSEVFEESQEEHEEEEFWISDAVMHVFFSFEII